MIVVTSLHTLQLKDRHVLEFHEAMHYKDHIFKHKFDPLSQEEAEGTKHIVIPFQKVGTGVYKNTTKTNSDLDETLICCSMKQTPIFIN